MTRVLIADPQPSVQLALRRVLDRAGFETEAAGSLEDLRVLLAKRHCDILLLDDGLSEQARRAGQELPAAVLLLSESDPASPEQVHKRRDLDALPARIRAMLEPSTSSAQARELAVRPLDRLPARGRAELPSRAWEQVEARIAVYSQHDLPVLIQGESGCGKEVVARALHEEGPRKGRPFVAIHCGAIPADLLESELFGHRKGSFTGAHRDRPGRFEEAGDGTLLLDEIGEMSPALQAKLLRTLENKEIHPVGGSQPVPLRARVLAATHRDLDALLEEGAFRRDLLHRLRVGQLDLPPLRERPEDLRPLCELFLAACRQELAPGLQGIDGRAWERLAAHEWPGNVRELFNLLRRAAVLSPDGIIGEAQLEALGAAESAEPAGGDLWREATRAELRRLRSLGLDQGEAAGRLRERLERLLSTEAPGD